MAAEEELDFEELEDNPLLAQQLELQGTPTKASKKKDKAKHAVPAPEPIFTGDTLEGEVSAWYPGREGLLGENYGYIQRTIGQFTMNGITVHKTESYCFDGSDATFACREQLDVRWRNLRVTFRPSGHDSCGRKKAVQVACSSRKRPSTPARVPAEQPAEARRKKPREAPAAPQEAPAAPREAPAAPREAPAAPREAPAAPPLEPPPAAETAAVSSTAAPEEVLPEAAPKKPADVASSLIRKALKKLGGEATKSEVVERIQTSAKLLKIAEEQLGELEIAWEEYITRRIKKVCEATGEKREGLKGSEAKIFRWLTEEGE